MAILSRLQTLSIREWVVVLLIVGAIVFFIPFSLSQTQLLKHKMLLGGKTFTIDIAATEMEKQQGLSGRDKLTSQQGIVFIYDEASKRCLWMKDMRFAIDMIWLSADKQITHIEQSVAPETYPRTYCNDGQYLIEVNAGIAQSLHLNLGDQVDF